MEAQELFRAVPPTEGVKHDAEKPRWDLLPFTELEDVVEVLTVGAKKYSPNNWKKVPDAKNRYIAAALRHISARCQDEIYDREDGLSHTAHAICCLLFLSWFDRKDIDDELTP